MAPGANDRPSRVWLGTGLDFGTGVALQLQPGGNFGIEAWGSLSSRAPSAPIHATSFLNPGGNLPDSSHPTSPNGLLSSNAIAHSQSHHVFLHWAVRLEATSCPVIGQEQLDTARFGVKASIINQYVWHSRAFTDLPFLNAQQGFHSFYYCR